MSVPYAQDVVPGRRDPLDWYIEVCGVCGCQLGPGIGARTRTGRCVVESHRSTGGVVVRVRALSVEEQHDPSGRVFIDRHPEFTGEAAL